MARRALCRWTKPVAHEPCVGQRVEIAMEKGGPAVSCQVVSVFSAAGGEVVEVEEVRESSDGS